MRTSVDTRESAEILLSLTPNELSAIIAALNFTKNRAMGSSWIEIDERVLNYLQDTIEEYRKANRATYVG